MPARRKPKAHFRADAFRAQEEERNQARRGMCSWLKFWKACGHKKCLRAQACAADVDDCFDRLWPIVPEWLKVSIRAAAKAKQARLPPPEAKAEIERALARWRETTAPRAAPKAPPQAAAEPAPPSPRIAPAARGPRVRVL